MRNNGSFYQFQLGSVIIDREAKTITIAELRDGRVELLVPERKIAYDTLVMALGSTSNDFNRQVSEELHFSSITRTRRVASTRRC